jgi:hypothetical protein
MNQNYYNILDKNFGEFRISANFGNLCDNLFITPIFKAIKDGVIEIHNEEIPILRSEVYKYLAKIDIKDKPCLPCPKTNEPTHISQKMLNYLGIENVNYLPQFVLLEEDISWAKEFLKQYDNPLAVMPTNSCSWDKSNLFAQMRTFTPDINSFIKNTFSKDYTLIQFGVDSGFYKTMNARYDAIEGIVHIKNLSIRQLASCYHVIGKIISCDTGDPYLMTAVGGKVLEIAPMKSPHIYKYWEYLYCDTSLWRGERVRSLYFDMSEYEKLDDYKNFDF